MNKARHKRVVSLFLPGSFSWPVTKFLWKFRLYLLWLSFHLHILYEFVHAEYIILIGSWSWLINNLLLLPEKHDRSTENYLHLLPFLTLFERDLSELKMQHSNFI